MTQILRVEESCPILNEINVGGFFFTDDASCYVWLHRGPANVGETEAKGWHNPSCGLSTASRNLLGEVYRESNRFNLPCIKTTWRAGQTVWVDEIGQDLPEDEPMLQVIQVMEIEGDALRELSKQHEAQLMATPEWQNLAMRVRAALSQIKAAVKKMRPDKRRECAHREIKAAAEKMTRKFRVSQDEVLTLLAEIIDEMKTS